MSRQLKTARSQEKSAGPRLANSIKAVLALLNSGFDDLITIAGAVGMPVDEVKRVESADDKRIRWYVCNGLPDDFVYRLRKQVVCPGCRGKINLVPCLECKLRGTIPQPRGCGIA